YRGDVITGLEQSSGSASIEPRHAAAEQLHVQLIALKIKQIQIGDLELAARRRTQSATKIDNLIVTNIKPWHGEMALRLLRFFFETDGFTIGVEFDNAITFRVANLIAKNARATLDGQRVPVEIEFPVKNVIAKNQGCAGVSNEFCADQKRLRDPFRLRLLCVLDANTELRAVAQIIFEHRQIFRRRNDQHLAKTAEDKSGERVANQRVVVNWQQLFADDFCQREQARPRAASEKNGFLVHRLHVSSW